MTERRDRDRNAIVAAEKGDSLWQDAWRRLRRNHMAMIGMFVVVFMSLTAVLAPWITPFDAETQEVWIGPVAPGTTHLELRNELVATVGARPRPDVVPQAVAAVLGDGREHELVYSVLDKVVTPVRLVVGSDGTISRVETRPPAGGLEWPDRIELGEDEHLRRAETGERLEARTVEVGGAPPVAGPDDGGRWVAQLEMVSVAPEGARPVVVRIAADGTVTGITDDGAPREQVRLRPTDVDDVTLDGERLEHTHLLGTDLLGRDTLSRVIYGGRISLLVGLVATLVSLLIGVLYGAVSGYAGGKTDAFLMRVVDVLYALPYLFLVILLLVAFGRSLVILFIALGAVQWLTIARIVRGQVLSLKEKEFVDAARTVGSSNWVILTRHLIPNTMGVVVVYTTLTVPAVILQESFLAFIGLTVEYQGKALESWGALVDTGRQALENDGGRWWLLVVPALAMSVTLFSMNFFGDGLRDALDPQMKGKS